jgi:death-on-curing protein
MKYLTAQDILVLHALAIDETGGVHGVRDVGLLQSIAERPKMRFGGKPLYPGVFTKAAAYFESLARYHVFIDGNKRTAVIASARFLFLNGIELTAANGEIEAFALRVVKEKLDVDTIAVWLKKHSKKKLRP